jgi:cell division FtsZ-interacting protein ZapD
MTKHERARLELTYIQGKHKNHLLKSYPNKTLENVCGGCYNNIFNFINEAEETEKELEELKSDIKRWIGLYNLDEDEIEELYQKLSKVGAK